MTATVAHRCALCNEVLHIEDLTPSSADCVAAMHHAVCPKRPLAVGDYVRWDGEMTGGGKVNRWAEGEIVSFNDGYTQVRVDRSSDQGFAPVPNFKNCLRRIPRPAAAPAFSLVATGSGALAVRTAHGDIKITADPTLKPGEFRIEQPKYRPVVVDKAAMERAMRDEKLMQRLQEEAGKFASAIRENLDLQRVEAGQFRSTCHACGGHWGASDFEVRAHRASCKAYDAYIVTLERLAGAALTTPIGEQIASLPDSPHSQALVDGLTRERCAVRWLENRIAVEGGARPPNAMTRMQRDVGRAMWLADTGAKRSAELRDRVAADREAERNLVRVDLEVLPWE